MKRFVIAAAIAAALAISSVAVAAEKWKIASGAQPGLLRDHHIQVGDSIGASTKNAFTAEFQFVGSEQEVVQQVVRGRLEVGVVSMIALASIIPEAAVLVTPYIWSSPAEGDYVIDKALFDPLARLLDAKGLVLLGFTETGWTDVVGKTPFVKPEDVVGRKIRVSPSPASAFFWKQLGANGVQLPLSELFPGLQSNLVEGADLPFVYYVTTPAAQSAPNYTLTRHTHIFNGIVVNKEAWAKMSADQQKAVRAGLPSYAKLRAEVRAAEEPLMKKFEDGGGKVIRLTDAQRKAWFDKVYPGQAAYVKTLGGESQALYDLIQKARQDYAAGKK
ncbi:MAG: TRAP transporter substrate-binding protein [Reyranellaceae bacterium]